MNLDGYKIQFGWFGLGNKTIKLDDQKDLYIKDDREALKTDWENVGEDLKNIISNNNNKNS